MRILLGVDDSNFAPTLVRAIAAQFRADDTDVMVLHVLQPIGPPPPQMGPGYAPELAEDNKLAQELVQRTANDLRAAGFKAETMVGVGDIREGIIDSAAEAFSPLKWPRRPFTKERRVLFAYGHAFSRAINPPSAPRI
jgi:hypothetical protein